MTPRTIHAAITIGAVRTVDIEASFRLVAIITTDTTNTVSAFHTIFAIFASAAGEASSAPGTFKTATAIIAVDTSVAINQRLQRLLGFFGAAPESDGCTVAARVKETVSFGREDGHGLGGFVA
jgi:hypothetical protein